MTQATELSNDDLLAIAQATQAIQAQLQAAATLTPDQTQALVSRTAEAALHDSLRLPEPFDDPSVLAWALGAWWGRTLCDDFGWRWIGVQRGDWRSMGVADPERRYLALPFDLLHRIVADRNAETPGTHARYNAIKACIEGVPSPLPTSAPGQLLVLTS